MVGADKRWIVAFGGHLQPPWPPFSTGGPVRSESGLIAAFFSGNSQIAKSVGCPHIYDSDNNRQHRQHTSKRAIWKGASGKEPSGTARPSTNNRSPAYGLFAYVTPEPEPEPCSLLSVFSAGIPRCLCHSKCRPLQPGGSFGRSDRRSHATGGTLYFQKSSFLRHPFRHGIGSTELWLRSPLITIQLWVPKFCLDSKRSCLHLYGSGRLWSVNGLQSHEQNRWYRQNHHIR